MVALALITHSRAARMRWTGEVEHVGERVAVDVVEHAGRDFGGEEMRHDFNVVPQVWRQPALDGLGAVRLAGLGVAAHGLFKIHLCKNPLNGRPCCLAKK